MLDGSNPDLDVTVLMAKVQEQIGGELEWIGDHNRCDCVRRSSPAEKSEADKRSRVKA